MLAILLLISIAFLFLSFLCFLALPPRTSQEWGKEVIANALVFLDVSWCQQILDGLGINSWELQWLFKIPVFFFFLFLSLNIRSWCFLNLTTKFLAQYIFLCDQSHKVF